MMPRTMGGARMDLPGHHGELDGQRQRPVVADQLVDPALNGVASDQPPRHHGPIGVGRWVAGESGPDRSSTLA
jgi:hypothetical protein